MERNGNVADTALMRNTKKNDMFNLHVFVVNVINFKI